MIVFDNPGLIDLDAALTMGVSVKEGDSPIGYFGTGLKFAIATILRHGGSIVMWRGAERHEFTAERMMIRGEEFDLVLMDGGRLGFTTKLGRDWEPWMAFRELASNCRDEGGKYFKPGHPPPSCFRARDGRTVFIVDGIDEIWPDRGSIVLETNALVSNEYIEIHPGQSEFIFYRGVRIYRPRTPTRVRYNVMRQIMLTEDRTAKYEWELYTAIEHGVGQLTDRKLLRDLMICGEAFLEYHLNLGQWSSSSEFMEIASELGMGAESVPTLAPSVAAKARKLAIENLKESDSIVLPDIQQIMLDRACTILIAGGYDVRAFPIIVRDNLGPGIMGLASGGRILLSRLAFERGTRELASTLIEEFAHLRSGFGDFTRELQNWIFEHLIGEIERNHGEPF